MELNYVPTLDTRFFIEFFGQKDKIKNKMIKQIAKKVSSVSVITLHELYKIFSEEEGKEIAKHRINLISNTYEVIDVTLTIAVTAADMRIHKNIPTADSIIAATAMTKDNTVVSDDPHFKQIKGLNTKWIY